ncbi:carbohydrate ABC transporter permease [Microbacterium deminutum]|uniref:Carbohydrate ABC transporter permease n=1 Tax=Microbacterium deminutum TaxID=344164 RepID=A0ABN2R5D4_9MICO
MTTITVRRGRQLRPGAIIVGVLITAMSILWLVPVYLAFVNASIPLQSYTGKPQWTTTEFGFFDNVVRGWEAGNFTATGYNSIVYSLVSATASVAISTIAAFALVVMPVKRPKMWFWIIYAGTLLPLQAFAIPMYQASIALNLYDTQPALIIVYTAICIPFGFFLVRNFMATLPPELSQAAKLDGAGWWRMFWSIYVPLVRPAMAAAFVFQFIAIWNELFFAVTLAISSETQPVMAALAGMQAKGSLVGQPATLAMAIVISLPTVAVFFIFQRYFKSGLTANL